MLSKKSSAKQLTMLYFNQN